MTNGKNLSVVIVAGGNGHRMQSETPKQFLPLGNETVLMKSIRCFATLEMVSEIIVVLPRQHIATWEELCHTHAFPIPHKTAIGGRNRYESVKAGLALCHPHSDFIAVHDGVRPFVTEPLIHRIFDLAVRKGNAIPAVHPTDTLRRITDIEKGTSTAVDRTMFRSVQTPQIFQSEQIRTAYEQPFLNSFTDDGSIVEHAGFRIYLTEGDSENIKLTTPFDLLAAAERLVKARPKQE